MISLLAPKFLFALTLLAQTDTENESANAAAATAALIASPIIIIVSVGFGVLVSAFCFWGVFTKAGQPGWGSLIPIVNTYFLCKAAGRPGWWLIWFIIGCVAPIFWIIVCIDIARRFGKGGGYAVGLILLPIIFFPILGYGSAVYQPVPVAAV